MDETIETIIINQIENDLMFLEGNYEELKQKLKRVNYDMDFSDLPFISQECFKMAFYGYSIWIIDMIKRCISIEINARALRDKIENG